MVYGEDNNFLPSVDINVLTEKGSQLMDLVDEYILVNVSNHSLLWKKASGTSYYQIHQRKKGRETVATTNDPENSSLNAC